VIETPEAFAKGMAFGFRSVTLTFEGIAVRARDAIKVDSDSIDS
jgi:hypothetical protein